uniref:Uncharacterized protein n=1 Tax=Opuntia streptacantha TaxID=393608 RepID=A0A7C8YHN6_OPUST
MAHYRVNKLALVIPFLTLSDILLRNPTLAEIDVTLLLINPKHHHRLNPADSDETVDTPNPTAREFREKNHAFDVVVLKQGDVGAHVGYVLDLYHNRHVHLRVLGFVHSALQVRTTARHG